MHDYKHIDLIILNAVMNPEWKTMDKIPPDIPGNQTPSIRILSNHGNRMRHLGNKRIGQQGVDFAVVIHSLTIFERGIRMELPEHYLKRARAACMA